MSRLTHDQYFLEMLKLVAARSTCARRAVGAIIVDRRHHILSTGYNGVPRGFRHCIDEADDVSRVPADDVCQGKWDPKGDTRRCMAVHAEVNAVIQCTRLDLAWKMYVSASPCFTCAKMIANTGIKHVIALELYADDTDVLKRAGISQTIIG